ncbi:ImmA/IrrE family metallo-endopeptidase [Metabacillus idriensis]|uniref:ImmA/IrrE family metallo-endopeptidase n=1 Tax=Metabacillus idriensis TaxID=324768 RepID=UPI0017494CAF|nr:ImmA/IrrE family metallo-endopeptidase [Metabacillus idriensis]
MESRELAFSRAEKLMDQYFGFGGSFPINMKMLASIAGISVQEKFMQNDQSGKLIIQGGKLIAFVNIFDSPQRQNFTIAHEIAHTLMDEFDHIQYRKKAGVHNELEMLCDEIASELLIPANEFEKQLEKLGENAASFKPLAKYFHASLEAIAVKFANCAQNQDRVILMITDFHGTNRKDLAIASAIPLKNWDIFIPRGLSIGRESALIDSFYQNKPIEKRMTLNLGIIKGDYLIETLPSKFQQSGKLYNKGYILITK